MRNYDRNVQRDVAEHATNQRGGYWLRIRVANYPAPSFELGEDRPSLSDDLRLPTYIGRRHAKQHHAHEQRPQPELQPAAAWLPRLSCGGNVGHAGIVSHSGD